MCSAVWPSLRHSALTASELRQSLLVGRSHEEVDTHSVPYMWTISEVMARLTGDSQLCLGE